MKLFAIRDEAEEQQKDLGYLLYYEKEKQFYVELPEHADIWETPLLLESFVKRGEKTVNAYWSKIWVQQRIIPSDRQNLGEILRDNGLKEYDEFELLMLAMGRCAQDTYYLVPIEEQDLPEEIKKRSERRVEDVLALKDWCLLVFFRDGAVKKCDLKSYFSDKKEFQILLKKPEYFPYVEMQVGGFGVAWDVHLSISGQMLYENGISIPLIAEDFQNYVSQRVVSAAEAAELMDCSRQNVIDLTKRGKLHPLKSSPKNTFYRKSEVLKRNWR